MKISTIMRRVLAVLLVMAAVLTAVFLVGRYGWKIAGFSACESAGIEGVVVTEEQVEITGFCPGTFPRGFLGYHAEEKDGILYVGFRFSGIFGIFETGDFTVSIPVSGEITQVVLKTSENEYPIWDADTHDR